MNGNGIPTLQSDQINVISHHINVINMKDNNHVAKDVYKEFYGWNDPNEWPHTIDHYNISKLTRNKILREEQPTTIEKFMKSEWKQLNRYHDVGMFGTPIPPPPASKILPWVWTYLYKENPLTGEDEPKSRGTCDGGKRRNGTVTLAETYASCVDQSCHRLTWALSAALDNICIGYDLANAYAEAPWGDEEPFYMQVDEQFNNWWTNCLHH